MGEFANIAVVLLAAGQGSRFGANKLAADLNGRQVARHAADVLRSLPFAHHIAVIRAQTPPLPGFSCVPLDPPEAPHSRSLAIGVAAARSLGARAVLIALADMPLVPSSHFEALVGAFDGDRITSRSADGTPLPPAMLGSRHYAALEALTGDRGAGGLLRGAPSVLLPVGAELDIDTPADLAEAERLLRNRVIPD